MANSRPSINTNDSTGHAPALDANGWLEVRRRHPPTAPASSNPQDIGQFVQQLSPEEPWDGIAMFRAPPGPVEDWPDQWQYQPQYQPQDQLYYTGTHAGYQQQPQEDYSSQQHTNAQAYQGSRNSERQHEGSNRDKSRRDGKPKKGSKSNSSRKQGP